jgi:hypothetical protein
MKNKMSESLEIKLDTEKKFLRGRVFTTEISNGINHKYLSFASTAANISSQINENPNIEYKLTNTPNFNEYIRFLQLANETDNLNILFLLNNYVIQHNSKRKLIQELKDSEDFGQ